MASADCLYFYCAVFVNHKKPKYPPLHFLCDNCGNLPVY
ncbi:hypothetical protein EBL_c22500 [Shimwellia blattae DSM 4481 = NBRC 105725]|uniref:Uncharacterized protein n=1 Tax=Shimwellia blattae (strain ATCC 29907 / DSM 4481 / JCM 1650 / NBRC 105725 / CDC 9005-74) TaxID=630626 RepID=I2B9Y7_SHIBC|nr:hypothetical protein EBL_c22500 [Shimwellia blattae DSM 4481 = NBRC 105725]